jgi:hypothetical protein
VSKKLGFVSAEPSNSFRASWGMTSHAGQYIKSGVEHRGSTIYSNAFNSLSKKKKLFHEENKSSTYLSLQRRVLITSQDKGWPFFRFYAIFVQVYGIYK